MSDAASDPLLKAKQAYAAHCEAIKSVVLGSVDSQGQPLASYAPYVMDEQRHIYVMLSGMSPHSQNLEATAKVSALFIEDEAQSKNVFARKRLTFDCSVDIIPPSNARFDQIADLMYERHGAMIERLRLMPDFRMFELIPQSGRFVIGFGAAYEISGDKLDQLRQLGGGHGNPHAHGSKSGQVGKGHGRDERSSSRLPAVPRGSLSDGMKKMIISHMNENHVDALCNMARVFGDLAQADSASMLQIDHKGFNLNVLNNDGEKELRIDFEKPLENAEEAHVTLVQMSRHAAEKLSES